MNAKMKVLSLALIGAFGYAGAAAAACPTGPTTGEGGAWTSKAVSPGSAFAVVTGGLDGSECKATAAIAGSLTGTATVTDDTPANEASYRFSFLADPAAFGSFSLSDWIGVFRANSGTAANGTTNLLTVTFVAGSGGARRVRFNAACGVGPSFRCAESTTVDLPAGNVRIEGKLTVGAGAAGRLDYWINAAQGTTEPAATGSIENLDNAAWVGVDKALLGLSGPSVPFKNTHANQAAGFDAFDSRRQTYIGW